MTSQPREIASYILDWRGVLIEVHHEAQCFCDGEYDHLTLESIEPARAPLPVSETGFRSLWACHEDVGEVGGALAYVEACLNEAAGDRRWIAGEDARSQLALF